jgi:hypothetical protein
MLVGVALVIVIIAAIWYYSRSSSPATEPAAKPQASTRLTHDHGRELWPLRQLHVISRIRRG